MIDQAKQDYIAMLLKGTKVMGNLIGTAGVVSVPFAGAKIFDKKYTETYKRMVTWECALNYSATHALPARLLPRSQLTTHIKSVRLLPGLWIPPCWAIDFLTTTFGIADTGRLHILASVQTITNGKSDPSSLYAYWPVTKKEFEKVMKLGETGGGQNPVLWLRP